MEIEPKHFIPDGTQEIAVVAGEGRKIGARHHIKPRYTGRR